MGLVWRRRLPLFKNSIMMKSSIIMIKSSIIMIKSSSIMIKSSIMINSILLLLLIPPCLSQLQSPSGALLRFKDSLTKSDALHNWKDDGSNPCDPNNVWVGIICSNGLINTINLSDMDLEGQPDVAALEPLDGLKALSIHNNSLAGPIPQINRLPSIKAFYAGSNWFSGVIPSDFFQTLGSLKKLWLQHNNFSGQIPTSIGQLPNLKELHLEHNDFSGPIPTFLQPDIITTLDLSNNNLQGQIPNSLNKFDAAVFDNNAGLCGPKLSRECKPPPHPSTPPDQLQPSAEPPKSSVKWIIMIVVVALLILIILARANQIDEDRRPLGKGAIDQTVVNIPTITKKPTTISTSAKPYNNSNNNISSSSSNTSTNNVNNNEKQTLQSSSSSTKESKDASAAVASKKAPSQIAGRGVGGVGDLVMVNEERGVFGLQDLMKAAAEVLGNGGLGSAYKAMLGNGVSVVVKRVREMNQMTKEVFDAEMKKLAKLKHQNILTPLAYHFRKEEKLLVSEYVPRGSLLYVLHGERGTSHAELELDWGKRLKIIKGVARGMGFLHTEFASYPLPHGDLKSSNVLIGSEYEPLLSDYAFYPLLNNTPTVQCMFAFKSPEAILNQTVNQKSDVYCMGIIILEIMTGKYPSQYCGNNQKGGTDVVQWVKSALAENRGTELIDPQISSSSSVLEMEKILHIGAACTESEPDERISLSEAIRRIEEVSV